MSSAGHWALGSAMWVAPTTTPSTAAAAAATAAGAAEISPADFSSSPPPPSRALFPRPQGGVPASSSAVCAPTLSTTTAAAAVGATCGAGAPKIRVAVPTSFVTPVRVGSDGHDGGSPDVSRVYAEAAPLVPVSGISPQVGVQL